MEVVDCESTAELLVASGAVSATMDNEWEEEDLDINPSSSRRVLTSEMEEEEEQW